MEDLWRVNRSGVDINDLADLAEYHRFLDRFEDDEVGDHKQNLLYGEACFGEPVKGRDKE